MLVWKKINKEQFQLFHFSAASPYSQPWYTVKNYYSCNLLTLTLSLYFFLSLAQDTSTNIRVTSFFARYCGSNGIQLCKKTQTKIPYFSMKFVNKKKGRKEKKEKHMKLVTEIWPSLTWESRWFNINYSTTKETKNDGLTYYTKNNGLVLWGVKKL